MVISYISAPCGSGKTFRLIEQACAMAREGRRVLILQPTIQLIERTVERELLTRPNAPTHHVFHGEKVLNRSVAGELSEFSKGPDIDGQLVFATHQVLPHIPFLADKHSWDVLVDEELQSHQCHSYAIPETHNLMTDHLELKQVNSIYSRVTVKDAMKRIATNPNGDQLLETFRSVAQLLTNRHWESFVNAQMHNDLINGRRSALTIHSILQPTVLAGFNSVTMASANFLDTMIYQLWSRAGVAFREDAALAQSLRFRQHNNGSLITIRYADEKKWSRKRRTTLLNPDGNERTTIQAEIVRATADALGPSPFIWQANKDVTDGVFEGQGERLPNLPHGLNSYAHINNVVFLSSLNPPPEHFRFLETLGIDGGSVRRAIYCSTAYQSAMRTSIRNFDNQEAKTIIVPDRGLAEYLQAALPGSKVEKLQTAIPDNEPAKRAGRPRRFDTDKDRVNAYRVRRKAELMEELIGLKVPYSSKPEVLDGQRSCNEKGIDLYTNIVTQPLSSTVYRDKFSANPGGYLFCEKVDQFVDCLRHWHSRQLEGKEGNFLISPAIFDPNHENREIGKKRGLNNIRYVQHLWMDFENGDLNPKELADLFPYNRLVVFNTYHHRSNAPRFRVVFLIDQQVTPRVYELLWDNVASKLEDAGYWVVGKRRSPESKMRSSGLDASKRTPASLFYAPGQAEDPADSFFAVYEGAGRHLLDPRTWIENNVVPFPVIARHPRPDAGKRAVDQAKVEKATEEWRQSRHHPGEGNTRFFEYALALRAAGTGLPAIADKLRLEAGNGRSPLERRRQIPSIIGSLSKPSGRARGSDRSG